MRSSVRRLDGVEGFVVAVVALDVVFERCRQPIDDPGWAGALGVEQADAVLLLLQEAQRGAFADSELGQAAAVVVLPADIRQG